MQATANKSYKQAYRELIQNGEAETVSYGISDQYVPQWTEHQALVEYVANFYDENGENFVIREEEGGVVLEDQSERGILLEDLVVGNSHSRDFTYKIGTHGEGFKLGALALVRLGKEVLIETVGNTIAFYLEEDTKLGSKILKSKIIKNERELGTKAYLGSAAIEEVKPRFLFLNDRIEKINDSLYKRKNFEGENHIYVNTLASQAINSKFSYALNKKQKVNRDRNMLEDPYKDAALAILGSKDEKMLGEWLVNLKNIEAGSFEEGLMEHAARNLQKKEFKTLDVSALVKTAKKAKVFYHEDRREHQQKVTEFMHQDKNFIPRLSGWSIPYFCEKILQNGFADKNPKFSRKNGELYWIPLDALRSGSQSALDMLNELRLLIVKLGLFDSLNVSGDNVQITMRNADAVDLAEGKIGNKKVGKLILKLYEMDLRSDFQISADGMIFDETDSGLQVAVAASFPEKILVKVKDKRCVQALRDNILFNGAKEIAPGLVYKMEGDQHLIDNAYEAKEKIEAAYSYRVSNVGEKIHALKNPKVAKQILTHAKNGETNKIGFEIAMMKEAINWLRADDDRIFEQGELAEVYEKQFEETFGRKACVTTDDASDKKAEYNSYFVVELDDSLNQWFKKLDVQLSKGKEGLSDKLDFTPIPKNMKAQWSEFRKTPYAQAMKACVMLGKILNDAHQICENNKNDRQSGAFESLLPNWPKNKLARRRSSDFNMSKSSAKKTIAEYALHVFERTFVTEDFGKESVRGLQRGGQIFVKKGIANFVGVFLHEYAHFATDLKDIDVEFEKTLALIGVLARGASATEAETEIFFKNYKKWSGLTK